MPEYLSYSIIAIFLGLLFGIFPMWINCAGIIVYYSSKNKNVPLWMRTLSAPNRKTPDHHPISSSPNKNARIICGIISGIMATSFMVWFFYMSWEDYLKGLWSPQDLYLFVPFIVVFLMWYLPAHYLEKYLQHLPDEITGFIR